MRCWQDANGSCEGGAGVGVDSAAGGHQALQTKRPARPSDAARWRKPRKSDRLEIARTRLSELLDNLLLPLVLLRLERHDGLIRVQPSESIALGVKGLVVMLHKGLQESAMQTIGGLNF